MTSLIDSYEQQYSNLTADITVVIGKLSNSLGDNPRSRGLAVNTKKKKKVGAPSRDGAKKSIKIHGSPIAEKQGHIRNVDKLFDEVSELLEQMELEVKDLPGKERPRYKTRLTSHKTELNKLKADLKRAKLGLSAREELLCDDTNDTEDQRARLLDNTEKLERSSRRLEHGQRVLMETEQMGVEMLNDLGQQRETIQRSRNRLRDMDADLGRSSRALSGMMKRIIQNRILLVVICLVIIIVIILAIYFTVRKKS